MTQFKTRNFTFFAPRTVIFEINFVHVKAVVGGSGKEWCFFTIPKAKGSKSFIAEWLGAFVVFCCRRYWTIFKPDGQSILRALLGGGQ